jgi:hypothetical protein
MYNDLSVGICAETVAEAFQLVSKLTEVIYFAVENHPDGFFPIRHRLVTTPKINYREPAKTQSKGTGNVVTFVIRAPMHERSCHRFDVTTLNRLQISKVILSTNAAHLTSLR